MTDNHSEKPVSLEPKEQVKINNAFFYYILLILGISTERIKGRVVEVSLADLKKNSDNMAWRKIKLMIEDVEGKYCRTSFYGMDMTRDKLCSFIRKW